MNEGRSKGERRMIEGRTGVGKEWNLKGKKLVRKNEKMWGEDENDTGRSLARGE